MRAFGEQVADQHALAAAQVADPPGAAARIAASTAPRRCSAERDRPVRGLGRDPRALERVVQVFRARCRPPRPAAPARPGQLPPVGQVAAGDQLLLRVAGEPAAARADQLVHLVGADPVVLGVVQHRQQHVEVVERVGQPHGPGQPHVQVARLAPAPGSSGRAGSLGRRDLPAERLEHAAAAGRRRHGTAAPERATPAGSATRPAPGGLSQRPVSAVRNTSLIAIASMLDAAYGRSFTYCPSANPSPDGPLTAAHEADRIDLEQQRRRAPLRPRLRVEHVRRAHRLRERLHPARMLVQQVSQVGRRRAGRGNGQQHNHPVFTIRPPHVAPIPPALADVAAVCTSTAWAAGSIDETLNERWNGKTWKPVPSHH